MCFFLVLSHQQTLGIVRIFCFPSTFHSVVIVCINSPWMIQLLHLGLQYSSDFLSFPLHLLTAFLFCFLVRKSFPFFLSIFPVSLWSHGFFLYSMCYIFFSCCYYLLTSGSLCPFNMVLLICEYSVLPGTRYSGVTLYFPCSKSKINHFPKEPWFLLVENGIQKPRWGAGCM